MATFLTTPRMNPALRARVERAVSHRTRAKHHAARIGLKMPFASRNRLRLAQLFPIVALVLVAGLGTASYAYGRRALEDERAALLSALEERRVGLPAGHEGFVAQTDRWISEGARVPDPSYVVDPALHAPGALDALLRRPAVYVRGAIAELSDTQKLDDAVRSSSKDAFLFCLLNPPASGKESDLLAKVRGVYFAGAIVDDQTANVRRLAEARIGLGVLGPRFEGATRAAEDIAALRRLRKELESSPTDEAKKAAAAELLIVVADGAGEADTRKARVSFVDLASKKVLLRLRPGIEPLSRSATAVVHREDMEGCSLALAVRRTVAQLETSGAGP
jgi:hypothetical protein